ncbi:MAG TPA: discoidin domain-containing protein, partial [Bryobacteraceae bacterium]|nr:discoidin domain-containing protein [Bryobacteraceae bacterium]
TVAAAWAMGAILLRGFAGIFYKWEARLFAFIAGSACLSAVVFLLCIFKFARPGVFLAIGLASIGYALFSKADRVHGKNFTPLPTLGRWLFAAVFAAFSVYYLLNAMSPEQSPDGVSYHLGVVAQYYRARGFPLITNNYYASLTQGIELLFLFAFEYGKHSAAAMVHFSFWIALPLMIFSYGRRVGHPLAGAAAALFTALSPVVGMDGSVAYVDVALAAYAFALFYVLQIWDQTRDRRLLILAGLFAGFAYEVKYTGGVAALYAVGFVAWKQFRAKKPVLRPALIVALTAFACMAPWMVKNAIEVANPVSPFASRWFPSPYVHTSQIEDWSRYLRKYDFTSYRELPIELTVTGIKTSGYFGPLFLLAPLALLALRSREGRQVLLAAAIFGATYFTNIGARFLIPVIPFIALALALVFERWKWLLLLLVAGHVAASTPFAFNRYASGAWAVWTVSPRAALRLESQDAYLTRTSSTYPVARMLDRLVPAGQKVFTFGPIAAAYTSREILVGWFSGPSEILQDILWSAMGNDQAPQRVVKFHFPERLIRRLRVVETARTPDQIWSVSELRVLAEGKEIPRAPEWRLSAHPNPWDVQLAFDNSPVTRWRTWQDAGPGMYIQIDFGRLQAVDSVTIETSNDADKSSLAVEELTNEAGWNRINAPAEPSESPIRASLRRAAAEEFKARGVRYLLIEDGAWGAKDFRLYSNAWGIRCIGQWRDSRLYYIE